MGRAAAGSHRPDAAGADVGIAVGASQRQIIGVAKTAAGDARVEMRPHSATERADLETLHLQPSLSSTAPETPALRRAGCVAASPVPWEGSRGTPGPLPDRPGHPGVCRLVVRGGSERGGGWRGLWMRAEGGGGVARRSPELFSSTPTVEGSQVPGNGKPPAAAVGNSGPFRQAASPSWRLGLHFAAHGRSVTNAVTSQQI